MSKLYTLMALLIISFNSWSEAPPEVPEYGKLVLVENRNFTPHFYSGLDLGLAMDNSYEDVYSFNALGGYAINPLWSLGIEITYNATQTKPVFHRLEKNGEIKISNSTPNWFAQVVTRLNFIKGHLNIFNKWNSEFELAAILGAGTGYSTDYDKTSPLVSWGAELLIPANEKYKFTLGIRHFKSYPFQNDELSFSSLLVGIRRTF